MISVFCWVLIFLIRLRFPVNKSVAEIITQRYGRAVLHTYRTLERTDYKFQKGNADLQFLKKCQENDLVPKFLNFKPHSPHVRHSEVYRNSQRNFLDLEIKTKIKRITSLRKQRGELADQLKSSVSYLDFAHLDNLKDSLNGNKILRIKAVHAKKLGQIGYSEIDELSPDQVLFNFSSRRLTLAEKSLLSKGLKFALPPKRLTPERYLYTFEKLFESLQYHTIYTAENGTNESFRDQLRHIAKSSFQTWIKHQPRAVLSEEESKALDSLSKDKSIIVARPDKGNGVVLMDKTDYLARVNTILEDTTKFEKLKDDTVPLKLVFTLEGKIRRFLLDVLGEAEGGKGKRSDTYWYLYPTGTNLGVLYGLPKVHKENFPIRPILSACNTPNYMLAKYLVPNLSPFTKNDFTVHSSFKFAQEICSINPEGLHMASFDVKSLFTNIPLQETIDIILFEIFDNPENEDNILFHDNGTKYFPCHLPDKPDEIFSFTKDHFKRLLELSCLDSYFFFNQNIYKQTDGVAMGSPLGPHLANIFMSHMEKKWLQNCPSDFKPVLYRRYVDDTFLLFNSRDHVQLFLTYLNSQHPNITFTFDDEQDGILPFLDVKVIKGEQEFTTSIYRKPTFTGLFSKFYSFSPKKNKENLISTLTFRAYKICSDFLSFHNEIQFLKKTLQANGYPLNFIELNIGKMLEKLHKPFDHVEVLNFDVPKAKLYFSCIYLGDISRNVIKDLKTLIGNSYPQVNVQFIFKSHSTIGGHFCFKDKQPKLLKSNLVYKYTCERCKAFYIGQTSQQLAARISEHSGISCRTGKVSSCEPKSDVYAHSKLCQVHVVPENFVILDTLPSENGLCILESLHQKIKKTQIGVQQKSTPLMSFD